MAQKFRENDKIFSTLSQFGSKLSSSINREGVVVSKRINSSFLWWFVISWTLHLGCTNAIPNIQLSEGTLLVTSPVVSNLDRVFPVYDDTDLLVIEGFCDTRSNDIEWLIGSDSVWSSASPSSYLSSSSSYSSLSASPITLDSTTTDLDCTDGNFALGLSNPLAVLGLTAENSTIQIQIRTQTLLGASPVLTITVSYLPDLPEDPPIDDTVPGEIEEEIVVVPPPDPTNLVAIAKSTTKIQLQWQSGGGTTHGFRISYIKGATPPSNCSESTSLGVTLIREDSISGNFHVFENLDAGTKYSFRVCAVSLSPQTLISSGVTIRKTTHSIPKVTGVYLHNGDSTKSGTFGIGTTIEIRVEYDANVQVITEQNKVDPKLKLTLSNQETAFFDHQDPSNLRELIFKYEVLAGNFDASDLNVTEIIYDGKIVMNEQKSTQAEVILPNGNNLANTSNVRIDGTKSTPTILDYVQTSNTEMTLKMSFGEHMTIQDVEKFVITSGSSSLSYTAPLETDASGEIEYTITVSPCTSESICSFSISLSEGYAEDDALNPSAAMDPTEIQYVFGPQSPTSVTSAWNNSTTLLSWSDPNPLGPTSEYVLFYRADVALTNCLITSYDGDVIRQTIAWSPTGSYEYDTGITPASELTPTTYHFLLCGYNNEHGYSTQGATTSLTLPPPTQ